MNFKHFGAAPILSVLLMLAAPSANAEGELMVMPATTRLVSTHDQNVTVKNLGDSPMYLAISLQKVTNPGMSKEEKVDLNDLEHPQVLVSPDKLTLGPSQSRAIRLKSLAEIDREELYRLYIVPVKSLKVDEAPQDKITAPMSVAVGYGVLVRHMPLPGKQREAWAHRCEQGGITLESTGTVRVVFPDITYSGAKRPETVAVFPGTPRHFATKRLKFDAGGAQRTVECP
ncbi:pilus assembly protein [Burkholderia territorii]|uniref:fimbrial biogenesis chaperone n=1 Tax=Burkholderia territorii TaxID=1503055 RepID=UPI00075BF955|nr:fimbria/pilus periplasmic chaperone [Burkholderia territorii]KWH08464.1 pilus assembly protein [Burkholderia territorii]